MIYRTDGRAVKSLSIDDVFGTLDTTQTDYNPRDVYRLVPFVRRAVGLRASAVSTVPITVERGGRDVSDRPEWQGLMTNLRTLLWRTEAAICLSLHGATWRRVTNRSGLNPTPEWLLPHYVRPRTTAEQGVVGVWYTHPYGVPGAGTIESLGLDEVVLFWLPNLDRADQPGPPPGLTALNAARVLANKDAFIGAYFGRGAIKSVLLQVPPDSKASDRDRLTSWWRGITSGVANAWRSIVVQSSVTPVVLGDGLKELNNESLTREYRQEAAAAFDIPETMLLQAAANYATAKTDRISFYEETVFPAVDRILDAVNTQWLGPEYDAKLVAHPELTQERQDAQLTQAEAITSLVGEPVMTVDEGRAWLGFEPLPRDAEAPGSDDADEEADFAAMDAEEAEEDAEEDEADALEDDEDEDDEAAKRYVRDGAGKYRALPGAMERKAERGSLMQAHRETRKACQQRHANERKACRERHIKERQEAADAKSRLKLVHRQRADLTAIRARQRSERMMLRSMLTAERSRVRDRHAAQRGAEVAAWKSRRKKRQSKDDDLDSWAEGQDLLDMLGDPRAVWAAYDDSGSIKKAPGGGKRSAWNPNNILRGPDGRFKGSAGGAQRKEERTKLVAQQKDERRATTERHAAQRASLLKTHADERKTDRSPEGRERRARERSDLRALQQQERVKVRQAQQAARQVMAAQHADARDAEMREILAERERTIPPRSRTNAFGTDPTTSYQMRHKIVDMDEIQASNTPTGAINPDYDPRLQPRDRSRQASQSQIDAVARRLNPEAVLTDFHQIDKGSPIVDASGNVLSGNGRTLALDRAADINPEVYRAYREQLRERAKELGLNPDDVDRMRRPVLVRELLGDTDTAAFAREANSSGTLRMSPMEQAKVDAGQISNDHMLRFAVKEDQTIDQALRDRDNAAWVTQFMSDIPANERANLMTRDGKLNQMGLYRVKAAIYTRAFPGAAGERMAESMLESLDPSLKNVQTGITASLPALSQVRALIGSGKRNPDLDITEDFAIAVDTLARIRDMPQYEGVPVAQRVASYLDAMRNSFFDDKLTEDQERILIHLDGISRKPTAVRDLLNTYANIVAGQSDVDQMNAFEALGVEGDLTRESLFNRLFGPAAPQQAGLF